MLNFLHTLAQSAHAISEELERQRQSSATATQSSDVRVRVTAEPQNSDSQRLETENPTASPENVAHQNHIHNESDGTPRPTDSASNRSDSNRRQVSMNLYFSSGSATLNLWFCVTY